MASSPCPGARPQPLHDTDSPPGGRLTPPVVWAVSTCSRPLGTEDGTWEDPQLEEEGLMRRQAERFTSSGCQQ